MLAIKEVIRDFTPSCKRTIYHQELLKLIRDKIVPYLERCRRLYAGTENAFQYVRNQIGTLSNETSNLNQLKEQLLVRIDEFIMERIIYA